MRSIVKLFRVATGVALIMRAALTAMRIIYKNLRVATFAVLFMGAALMAMADKALAASCCGGGSASSLVAPKTADQMLSVSFDWERYDGYWDGDGDYIANPPGSDISQYRMNTGYVHRFTDNWQASANLPLIFNNSTYEGTSSRTNGMGDMTLGLWYETFDEITCVFDVNSIEDLKPAVYLGASLVVPTGVSPYDNVDNSFDITGRGFYRLDGSLLVEKTIYPWTVTINLSYGLYFERPVNREYGQWVEPYHRKPGARTFYSLAGGYTWFLDSLSTFTLVAGYADLREDSGTIDGATDSISGMQKKSWSLTASHASPDLSRVYKLTLSHAPGWDGWGKRFPVTDVITLGYNHVF